MATIDNMGRRRFGPRNAFAAIIAAVALLIAWAAPAMPPVPPPGTWTTQTSLPSPVEGASTGLDNAFIVAAYGYSDGDTNLTRVYCVNNSGLAPCGPGTAGTWVIGAPAPLPVRSEGIGVFKDGWLYSIGGRSGGVLQDFDRYHVPSGGPFSNTWQPLPLMLTARAGLGGAVSGKYIYAIGGRTGTTPCTGTALGTMEKFDVTSGSPIPTGPWVPAPSLPAGRERSDLAALAMGNSKIYVFGGCNASNPAAGGYVDVFDIASNTWSLTPPPNMPTPRAAFYQVGFIGPQIYVIGGGLSTGEGLGPVSCANEVFNTNGNSNTWLPAATPMLTCRGEMGVGSVGGTIWTVGGAMPCCGSSSNAVETFKLP